MGKPAARISDSHSCPMVTPGGVLHEGGKIIAGCQTVWIENELAATLGDVCLCNGGFLDVIASGSTGVFIEGKPAARQGDLCAHGGRITSGSVTVFIGDISKERKVMIINQAIQECIALLERKLELLELDDPETLDTFKKWFGRVDEEAKQTILIRIKRALEVSRTLTIENFGEIADEKDRREVNAQVYNKDRWYVYFLGDPFWQLGTSGKRSKAGVLIHELSHFKEIGNTLDNACNEKPCLRLVECDPDAALNNADSFEFFIEY